MFIPKEKALAMAEGRKRFFCIYQGKRTVMMPFVATARHVATHYVHGHPKGRSYICPGPGCTLHHLPEVAKLHVAAYVFRHSGKYDPAKAISLPDKPTYDAELWIPKIVELTEACFAEFYRDQEYGTIASIGREPGRVNNKVVFCWLDGKLLHEFPADPLSPETIVPAVIRGVSYNSAEVALDESLPGPTKHKMPYRS